jgi:TetR/AcrR family transcriptional regulator, transcriptional repressor for nem operon
MPKPNVREQIVVAALETLHRRGFNGCGVQDITEAAGVPKGSFYNHFESKEALGVAVLDRYWQICGDQLRMLSDERVPPIDRLRSYFESLVNTIVGQGYARGCLIGNFSIELADQSRLVRERLTAIFAAWTRALETCIREAQRGGAVRSTLEAGTLAALLLSAWEGAVMRVKVDKDDAAFRHFMTVVFTEILS